MKPQNVKPIIFEYSKSVKCDNSRNYGSESDLAVINLFPFEENNYYNNLYKIGYGETPEDNDHDGYSLDDFYDYDRRHDIDKMKNHGNNIVIHKPWLNIYYPGAKQPFKFNSLNNKDFTLRELVDCIIMAGIKHNSCAATGDEDKEFVGLQITTEYAITSSRESNESDIEVFENNVYVSLQH